MRLTASALASSSAFSSAFFHAALSFFSWRFSRSRSSASAFRATATAAFISCLRNTTSRTTSEQSPGNDEWAKRL